MERRDFLKIAFGFAAATTATVVAASTAVNAAPLMPASPPAPGIKPASEPAIARDADVEAASPEQVRWGWRRRRFIVVRRRRFRRWRRRW